MTVATRPLLPCVLLLATLWLLASPAGASSDLHTLDPEVFPVPVQLETNVAFWTDIFTRYTSYQVVLHDERFPEIVYTVVDLSGPELSDLSASQLQRRRDHDVNKAQRELTAILQGFAAGKKPADDRETRLAKLLDAIPDGPAKYREAAAHLRSQPGLKDHFTGAIQRSGRYLPALEEIFRGRGLPVDLTRLPFVESMFQERARSNAAAAGIWQFMTATGNRFLNIGLEMDERYDPLRSTEAAAKLLEENYRSLQTWPLAITAYNYGSNGLQRAVARLGTRDLGVIIEQHRSRTFGFASRNFYSEFVAAASVYLNRDHYFPGIEPNPPLRFAAYTPDRYVAVQELAQGAGVSLAELQPLNPALNQEIWNGHLLLPQGYTLRVPEGMTEAFHTAYSAIPEERKPDRQLGFQYRVRSGDTLGKIAQRFDTSAATLQRANRLASAHRIRVGQILLVPPGKAWQVPKSTSSQSRQQVAETRPTQHIVRRGETLLQIAQRYGTTVDAIQQANRIRNHLIYPQQKLLIP